MKKSTLVLMAGAAFFFGFFFKTKEEELEDKKMVWLINEDTLEGLEIKQQFILPLGEVVKVVSLKEYLQKSRYSSGNKNHDRRVLVTVKTVQHKRKTFPSSGKE